MQLTILFYASLIIPLALISGPLIPELLILISVILISTKFKLIKNYIYQEKKFCTIFLIFNLYLIFTSFFSDNYFLSFKNTIPFFRFLILAIIIFIILDKYKNKFLHIFFLTYIFIFLILAIDGYLSYLLGKNIFGFPSKPDRISSLFGDEYILGSYIIRLMPIVLVSLIFSNFKQLTQKILFLSTLLISLFLIIMSGERTALGLYFIFLGLLIFEKRLRKYFFKISIIFTIIVVSTLLFFSNSGFVKRIVFDTIHQVYDKGGINFFSPRHESHFLTSYYIFKDNPIFGSGPNTFRVECRKDRYINLITPFIEEHNTFISPVDGTLYKVEKSIYEKNKFKYFIRNKNQEKIHIQQYPKKFEINEVYIKNFLVETSKFPLNIREGQKLWVKNFSFVDGCNTHPHSIVFQLLAEVGIVGIIFLLLFYTYLIKQIIYYQKIRSTKLRFSIYLILISLIINFFPLLPYGNFFNNWFSIINFLPLGFLFYLRKSIKNSTY